MLLYDFYAFVPQGIYGYLKDDFKIKLHFGYLGFSIVLLSLLLYKFNIYPLIVKNAQEKVKKIERRYFVR